jgi:Holliday junction resolvase
LPAFSKEDQLRHTRAGVGMKKNRQVNSPADEDRLIKKDVKHNKDRATAQEYAVRDEYREAGYLKTRKVPGSGAYHDAQLFSDVEVENLLLVECKESRTGKLQIEPEWVKKVSQEAKMMGKQWWAIHAWTAEGEQHYDKLVVVDQQTWMDLVKQLHDLTEENTFLHGEITKTE